MGRVYNGSTFVTYTDYDIGDGVVADLDGDGQYEIVFFWTPKNEQDNSLEGFTGNVFIDAYKLDGTKIWGEGNFINLGNNIRAGAHYNTFLVYDFDGDGKAEIIVKTADGTTDATGAILGDENANYIQNTSSRWGRILEGPEYISVFDGATGKFLDTQPYQVARGNINNWGGDTYGNRVDRFLSCVAYLDGVRPSAVTCRGYYTRTTLTAWNWDGKTLAHHWTFDTRPNGVVNSSLSQYEGQGNHSLAVADVDGDGKDEIIYGAMTFNSDGTPRYNTRTGHGDAMHVGKHDPARPGLQVTSVMENSPYGIRMQDADTGEIIWRYTAGGDTGRGLTADIDPEYPGAESWGASGVGTFAADGTRLAGSISPINMAIWWDGDTGRELFDGTNNPTTRKVNASNGTGANLRNYSISNIFTYSGASTSGGTKQNPCLQADILGDWREEIILRSSDNSELRVYSTVTPTVHTGAGAVPSAGIPTLMHDNTYRMAIAWQHSGYNQPPHTGFFLGYNMQNVPRLGGAAFTVTFDPNGGTFDDNSTVEKQISTVSGAYFDFPKVEHTGKVFEGWYFSNGEKFDPTVIYKEDIIFKAAWTPNIYTLFFDSGCGANPESKTVSYGEPIGELPEPSCDNNFIFEGWAEQNSGEIYTAATDYNVDSDITLYALWKTVVNNAVEENIWQFLTVYPNPVSKDIVSIDGLDGGEMISFVDIGGRLCLQFKAAKSKEDISVNHLAKGIYLVVITKDKSEKTVKLVVK